MTNDDTRYRKKDSQVTTSDPETVAASNGFVGPNVIARTAKLLKLLKDRLFPGDRTALELKLEQSSNLPNGRDNTRDPEMLAASDGFVVLPDVPEEAGKLLERLKNRLSPDDQEILYLKLEQLSATEIADAVVMPLTRVEERLKHVELMCKIILLEGCCE